MSLVNLQLPNLENELISYMVFPFLQWNDLLCLRVSCQDVKNSVDNFITNDLGGIPASVAVEINEGNHNWSDIDTLINLDFLLPNIYLNNPSGKKFFEHQNVSKFLAILGNKILKLRVEKFTAFPTTAELEFYDSLYNLSTLEILDVVKHPISRLDNRQLWYVADPESMIPDNWKHLKHLMVRYEYFTEGCQSLISARKMSRFNSQILTKCKKLETVELGLSTTPRMDIEKHFDGLISYVQHRAVRPEAPSNLKLYKFPPYFRLGLILQRTTSVKFLELCTTFRDHGVKMENVPARLFKMFSKNMYQADIVSQTVSTMCSLHPAILTIPLPEMTRLFLKTHRLNSLKSQGILRRADWPNLQDLTVVASDTFLDDCHRRGNVRYKPMQVNELFHLLFGNGKSLPSLNALCLQFTNAIYAVDRPNIADIVACCPNITKLEIVGWPAGNNLPFSKLWTGLQALEEVTLSNCELLGDSCFIGDDWKRPAFLQLKHLRKLSLLKLDKMEKITDRAFLMAFRHLELREFIISSKKPMKNVTMSGIFSLLTGKFANSVEKFPFTGWSVQDVGEDEGKDLANQFRHACAKLAIMRH